MSYNIIKLKEDLEGILHGTTTDDITNLNQLINRALRQLLQDVDPQETKRITLFTNPIYSSVYDYALPIDLKGNKIIDIRPIVDRKNTDRYSQLYSQDFDISKEYLTNALANIKFNNGTKTIRINYPGAKEGTIINSISSLTGNGTWATGGDASNLEEDHTNYVSSNSSLKFDLDALGTAGYIENSTMAQIDLSNQENESALFVWVYLPTASNFTSVELIFGSDSTNYWSSTKTTTQSGTSFQNGWNLIQFGWDSETGSPDSEKINYAKLVFNYDGTAQTGVRADAITSRMGNILEIEYYSKYLLRDVTTSAFKEEISVDTDIINLDTDSYNMLTYLVAMFAVQQQSGAEGKFDMGFFKSMYDDALSKYKQMYRSEVQKPKTYYYKQTKPPFTRLGKTR